MSKLPDALAFEIHERGNELTVYIGPMEEGSMTHTLIEGTWTGYLEDGPPEPILRAMTKAPEMFELLEALAYSPDNTTTMRAMRLLEYITTGDIRPADKEV